MGVRDAVQQSGYLTALVIGFGIWLAVIAVRTFNSVENAWISSSDVALGEFVGPSLASGIAGIVVMVIAIAMLFVMFGELEESEPSPAAWPPEEDR